MITIAGLSYEVDSLGVELTGDFHASQLSDPFYRYMQRWHSGLVISADESDDPITIGRADVLRLRVYDIVDSGVDPWEVLDAEEGDLEMVGRVLLDGGGFRDELDDELQGWESDLLILNHVELEPAVRGIGLGPLFASLTLEPLLGGARVVACYPAPIGGEHTDASRAEIVAKLGRTWAKAGFRPLHDGVWILDPATVEYSEAWERLHRGFGLLRD